MIYYNFFFFLSKQTNVQYNIICHFHDAVVFLLKFTISEDSMKISLGGRDIYII